MENKEKAIPTTQVVLFQLGTEFFGVDILQVLEIVRIRPVSYVPETPDFVEGVMNLRGNVIPIINLRKKFGLAAKTPDKQSRIVIFELEEKKIGAVVDHVDQILRIPEDRIELPPEMKAIEIQEYILAVGKTDSGLVILLDIHKVLTEGEIIQLHELDALKDSLNNNDDAEHEEKEAQEQTVTSSKKDKKKRVSVKSKK